MVANDLTRAVGRSCYWVPDYSWIALLKPLAGRTLQIGPGLNILVQDAANQTQNAGVSSILSYSANTITANIWPVPTSNQAVMFENLRAWLVFTDTSAKLSVVAATLSVGDGSSAVGIQFCQGMPFTAPAISGGVGWQMNAYVPVPLLIPRPTVSAAGPSATISLVNTDGGASHTFKRGIQYTFRVIDNVDFSMGPAVPGAGEAL